MEKMKKLVFLIFIITGLLTYASLARESVSEYKKGVKQETEEVRGPADPVELEAFLDGIMTAHMKTHHIAGATLSIVKDGNIFFAKGYGYADVENKKPVVADKTLFRPGSVSKLFVWTAVMQLVEQGKLDLDADLNIYLKDFKIPDTFSEPITMKHLLTHTPGFEDVVIGMAARRAEDLVSLKDFLDDKMPTRVFPPGKFTAYSNYGSALAAYIVQEVSGMPFEDYIEEYIYKPLDMQHSTFRQPLPSRLKDDMSVGYTYKNGVFKAEPFELINGMAPAGSMSSTAADMARFMISHLQRGRYGEVRILKEETAELMHSQLFAHDSRVDGNAYGFWERRANNLRTIGHGGDSIYFHTLLVLIPEKNIGLFVSYNSADASGPARNELVQAFLDRYYPIPDLPKIKPASDFKKRASRYVGTYGVNRLPYTTLAKLMSLMISVKMSATDEGTLLMKLPYGSGAKQYVELEPHVFRELDGEDTLVFREDRKGRITHFFLNEIPMFAAVKLAWYQIPEFHYSLLAIAVILFLSTLIWPIGLLSRKVCKREKEEKNPAPWFVRWTVGTMGGLYVLFLVGLVGALSDPMQIMFGVPPLLKVMLVLPLIAAVLTIGALFLTYLAWKNKYWSGCGRVHYTLIVFFSLAFIWFLNYWNLFGFRF